MVLHTMSQGNGRVLVVVILVAAGVAQAAQNRPHAVMIDKNGVTADMFTSLIVRLLRLPANLVSQASHVARTIAREPEPIEATMSGPALILHWGYPGETHSVQTPDSYVLSLFRVPWGRGRDPSLESDKPNGKPNGKPTGTPRPVVVLMHGLLQSADQWLMRGPGEDLAFILADLGFDVWMGNFRGSTYSRRHKYLSPKSKKFWNFGWQENAMYDLPTMLDYVSAVTGQESVFYVGHSMGTTTLLALLAERPDYNARIRSAFLLAPIVHFDHLRPDSYLATFRDAVPSLATTRIIGELFPRGTGNACRSAVPLCVAAYNAPGGYSPQEFNSTLFRILLGHFPSGGSIGQLLHFAQLLVSGEFKKYDYGPKENVARYGQPTPPPFRLSNVVAPMYLVHADGDTFSSPQDIQRLAKEIPGIQKLIRVPVDDFGHTDHLYAINSYKLVYEPIIDIILDSMR